MILNEGNCSIYLPDTDALSLIITNEQLQAIEYAIQTTFMMPTPEQIAAHQAEMDQYNEKYGKKDEEGNISLMDIPMPPMPPKADGIPADFALIIIPHTAAKTSWSGNSAKAIKSREAAEYRVFGSDAARSFVVEKCGIEV